MLALIFVLWILFVGLVIHILMTRPWCKKHLFKNGSCVFCGKGEHDEN